jgi:hypothetical protein
VEEHKQNRHATSYDVVTDDLIPWDLLRGKVLEELLYELLNELGANELIWRSGGIGAGAPDGGRDLEAIFHRATPDGEVESEKWWIEAKGRSKTVEADAVKSTVLNASGPKDLDLILIATNSQFSNPTRDWIQSWVNEHPRPKVKLWDCKDLLRLIRKHPVVAARIVPDILPDRERIRMLADQFLEVGKPPSEKDLQYFWEIRDIVSDPTQISCLVYGELLYGDLVSRPWGILISEENHLGIIIEALGCLPFALLRTKMLSNERLAATAVYLVQCALRFGDPKEVAAILDNPLKFVDGIPKSMEDDPSVYREAAVDPIWQRCKIELLDACSQDCPRINGDTQILRPSEAGAHFWRRFNLNIKTPNADGALLVFDLKMPCAVGLELGERTCPLEEEPKFSSQEIEELKAIINYRRIHPDGRYLELVRTHSSPLRDLARHQTDQIEISLRDPGNRDGES